MSDDRPQGSTREVEENGMGAQLVACPGAPSDKVYGLMAVMVSLKDFKFVCVSSHTRVKSEKGHSESTTA